MREVISVMTAILDQTTERAFMLIAKPAKDPSYQKQCCNRRMIT